MDLRLLYSDFAMDDRELVFHSTSDSEPSYHDDLEITPIVRSQCYSMRIPISHGPIVNKPSSPRYNRLGYVWDLGRGRSHTRSNLRTHSGLCWSNRGRRVAGGPSTCGWT